MPRSTTIAVTTAMLTGMVLSSAASALEVEHIETRYAAGQYHCELVAVLDAPAHAVEDVLRDYEHYPALDPRILQARVLARPAPGTVLLETHLRTCFGPFCRTVVRIETVREAQHALSAVTDPARSDVRFGETQTTLEPANAARTRITYRSSVTPGFWIPAVVGRRWMLRAMEQAALDVFRGVEARAKAPREIDK